ncbi:CocE/NonD family hydrolase [Trichocoleus desertorum AS-A10]|uniref:CocE/NonD family hydrolase n=1 Tax=Trichocoleus desertorum TaxID=1481672 RepID=UPI003296FA63
MFSVRPKETVSMLTRDRVRLDADVYRPDAVGEFPVLLMRQPYGRAIASTVVYAHPTWYAAYGYIVVIQDVRGRGTSEGEFDLFAHEIEDGFDAVNWAAELPGSNGQVGMYGFSYQGMTQLYAAIARPSALKALCPSMIGYDLYSDWAYENGAFCLQANLGWAIQLAAETARLRGDEAAFQKLYVAARNLPLHEPIPARPHVLKDLAPDSFYHDWLEHPTPDDYWAKLSPKTHMQNQDIDLPMLHIGGWFDPYLRGTLHLYQDLAARSQYPQHLVVGPWAHLPWGRKLGAIDYGPEANSPIDTLQIRWFDQFLKGINTGLQDELPVRLFEMGSNEWSFFEQWPEGKPKAYFLASNGLASLDDQTGTLVETPPEAIAPDVFVHDPWRPVPASGGHAPLPAGSYDRSTLDCRTDIVTYTSAPLIEDLHIVGEAIAEIHCTADQPSFDLCVVLSEIKPNGSVYNLTQGYMRVNPGQTIAPLTIPLQATCVQIAQGNALRLSISGACFPAYPVNPGTGAFPAKTRLIDSQIITVAIASGKLILPTTE